MGILPYDKTYEDVADWDVHRGTVILMDRKGNTIDELDVNTLVENWLKKQRKRG